MVEVDADSLRIGRELRPSIQLRLRRAPVVAGLPVFDEVAQPTGVGAIGPIPVVIGRGRPLAWDRRRRNRSSTSVPMSTTKGRGPSAGMTGERRDQRSRADFARVSTWPSLLDQ